MQGQTLKACLPPLTNQGIDSRIELNHTASVRSGLRQNSRTLPRQALGMPDMPSLPPFHCGEKVDRPRPKALLALPLSPRPEEKHVFVFRDPARTISATLWTHHSLAQAPFPSPSPSQNPFHGGPPEPFLKMASPRVGIFF